MAQDGSLGFTTGFVIEILLVTYSLVCLSDLCVEEGLAASFLSTLARAAAPAACADWLGGLRLTGSTI